LIIDCGNGAKLGGELKSDEEVDERGGVDGWVFIN
jgi:hypothetical protein